MNSTKPKPKESKLLTREAAKPLVQPETRPLRDDHPAAEIYRAALEATELSGRPHETNSAVHEFLTEPATPPEVGRPLEREAGGHIAESLPAGGRPLNSETISVDGPTATKRRRGRPRKILADGHKKDRHKGNKARYDNRIDPAVHKQIQDFIREEGFEQQDFAELSAVHFIRHYKSADGHKKEGRTALDYRLKILGFITAPFIINLYLKLVPENRWKIADDRAATAYNSADPRLIEIAMLTTVLRAKSRINSFGYFVPEIDYHLSLPLGEAINPMLASARRQWEMLGK